MKDVIYDPKHYTDTPASSRLRPHTAADVRRTQQTFVAGERPQSAVEPHMETRVQTGPRHGGKLNT